MIHPLTMGSTIQHLGPHTLNGQLQWSEFTAQLERAVQEAGAITDRPLRVVLNNLHPVNKDRLSLVQPAKDASLAPSDIRY